GGHEERIAAHRTGETLTLLALFRLPFRKRLLVVGSLSRVATVSCVLCEARVLGSVFSLDLSNRVPPGDHREAAAWATILRSIRRRSVHASCLRWARGYSRTKI